MGKNLRMPREYRAMVNAAIDQGWTLKTARGGHPKITSPDGTYASPIPTTYKASGLYRTIRKRLIEHGLVFDPARDRW